LAPNAVAVKMSGERNGDGLGGLLAAHRWLFLSPSSRCARLASRFATASFRSLFYFPYSLGQPLSKLFAPHRGHFVPL
jgi:hypothetical protein